MDFKYGQFNVHYLTGTYQEIVKAFGYGTKNFDSLKQFAQWNVETSYGLVEIYDYGYADSGEDFELEDITDWHVQGPHKNTKEAIEEMLQLLGDAN